MSTPQVGPPRKRRKSAKNAFHRIVEFQGIRRLSLRQYRDHVRDLYDGPKGAMLEVASILSLHIPLMGHVLKSRKFDVTKHHRILDVGAGAGQIMRHLLRLTPPDAELVAFDLSHKMLGRARQKLKSNRPSFVTGDLMKLPFADNTFDCVTCGYVIEHLPDPLPGLIELERVLRPGGSALILATEDTFQGAFTSRTWKCRTYNRAELKRACEQAGMPWKSQLWFTPVHRFFKMGGILVEATKPEQPSGPQSV